MSGRNIASRKKPQEIPNIPWAVYKDKWKSIGDWLGTEVRPFAEARQFVHKLELRSVEEWKEYCKSAKRPVDIPSNPRKSYRDSWKDWVDWLGIDAVEVSGKVYRPFAEARQFVWKKPPDIPNSPSSTYKKECKGWGDWLGTGRTREHRTFFEAREFVHSLGLNDRDDWKEYCKSGKKPHNIPTYPNEASSYKTEWKSWPDWLGTEETIWSVKKVKELLGDWIESGLINEEKDIVLLSLLSANGLLNLRNKDNRHGQFFKNLIEARHTDEGLKNIKEYAYSDSEEPPELGGNGASEDEELGTATELNHLTNYAEARSE